MTVAPASPQPRRGRRNGSRSTTSTAVFLRDLLIIVLVAVLASFLIKTFLVRSFYIPSGSMEHTLLVNDRVLVDELVPQLIPLRRGDVIVFTDPGEWLDTPPPPPLGPVAAAGEWVLSVVGLSMRDQDDHLIKRVIGLPGDHVECCNALGQMSVNGTPLDERSYVQLTPGTTAVSGVEFDVTVPKDRLWVMGDNRYRSSDSRAHQTTRSHGYVPVGDVVGRAFVISWPLGRWSVLSNQPDTFGGVPAPTP